MTIRAIEKWDIDQSLIVRARVKIFDPEYGEPGWCWNSAVAATMLIGRTATYVEGWIHNVRPGAPFPRFPHAWTVLPDGTIIDTTSGAEDAASAAVGAYWIGYEPTLLVPYLELIPHIDAEITPPITPEFSNWQPPGN